LGIAQFGCNGSIFSESEKNPKNNRINVNPEDVDYIIIKTGDQSLGVGGSKKISAEIVMKDGTIVDGSEIVTWKSGDNNVAEFAGGANVLTGKTPGKAEITASIGDQATKATISVSDRVNDAGGAGGAGGGSNEEGNIAGGGGESGGNVGNQAITENGVPTDPNSVTPCPAIDQNILVIDFKSGWWAGDAGTFFNRILNTMTAKCNGKVTIEYHHIIYDKLLAKDTGFIYPGGKAIFTFQQNDWNAYNQIWLLSGADYDNADLRDNDPFYQNIQQKIVASKSALLIGAGYGSIYHANSLSAALGMGSIFMPGISKGLVQHITNVKVLSRLTMGAQLLDHELFSRGVKSIADTVQIENKTITTDWLMGTPAGGSVIGKSNVGTASIVVATVGGSRRVVLDAGLQRFYAIYNADETDTLVYLENIISYLSDKQITAGP
jgi:hypothetical protein